ncbi:MULTISPECIES: signal peptide peptidase SppA [Acidiplasma]|uniref:Signal peptidase n=3 Tax=Acidiplasma TaxID=507753 RepID=A0A0Q0VQF1_9ARCH|nr:MULTISPECIES: signal peptide peptidase SppA [Acidiplasma]KJE49036.1 signal peptidase [Acidiplasma sp. MBA-1]KPV44719.1 signal peptidase [Acidiplasma aeolicum]KQB33609.1 signal peptidase [Acidiplasma aeolicum]KQB36055.1 signal peptidase [Acidiplasma cupricumulans]WMT54480.1 MAG: signal peptide peptidase SppA [Acidiplasma sp.]
MYIATLNINGTINQNMVSRIMPVLDYVYNKNKVRGLILIINSGGGDANSTEIIYNKLRKIAEKKPVYSSILGTGASGAYWLACASEKIFAMPTSIVGSIGVISISADVSEFLSAAGIRPRITKIGKYKDMNSPFRPMTDEEQNIYYEIMQDVFKRFRDEVKSRRNIKNIDDVATGLVFSSSRAKELSLIDEIGDTEACINDMKNRIKSGIGIKDLTPRGGIISRFISMSTDSFFSEFFKNRIS